MSYKSFGNSKKSSIFWFDSNLKGDVVNEHRMYTYYNIELIGYGHFSDWHLKQRFFIFYKIFVVEKGVSRLQNFYASKTTFNNYQPHERLWNGSAVVPEWREAPWDSLMNTMKTSDSQTLKDPTKNLYYHNKRQIKFGK